MVIHYPPARLRYNSDQPTAITNVLVATSGSSHTGEIPLVPRPARPAPAGAAGRCIQAARRSWSSGPAGL